MTEAVLAFSQACDGLRDCVSTALNSSRLRLELQSRCSLTLVQAPFGYGKTLLLRALHEGMSATHECFWLEPRRGAGLTAVSDVLHNGGHCSRPRALFIEDVESDDRDLVRQWIAAASEAGCAVRTHISTSNMLQADSGFFAGADDISVIGHRDLAIGSEQFRKDALPPMQRRQLHELLAHTGGWPVALRLACIHLPRIVLPDGRLDLRALDEPLRAYVEIRLRQTLTEEARRKLAVLASLGTQSVPPRAPRELLKVLAKLAESASFLPLLTLQTDPGPAWNGTRPFGVRLSLHCTRRTTRAHSD